MTKNEREALKILDPMHCITIYKTTVRVHIEKDQDYFDFNKYGGKDRAIAAAIKYRDSLPDSMIHSKFEHGRQRPRGAIPHSGIAWYRNSKRLIILGYYVQWREGPINNRKTKTRAFRFDQYHDALAEAIEFRERMIDEHSILKLNRG